MDSGVLSVHGVIGLVLESRLRTQNGQLWPHHLNDLIAEPICSIGMKTDREQPNWPVPSYG
jgi:hypothetical protein